MYDGTRCIWPNCIQRPWGSGVTHLCADHVQFVVDAHKAAKGQCIRRRTNRISVRPAPIAPGPGYFEQKRLDRVRESVEVVPPRDGWIYYVRAGGNYKIGWARDLGRRLKQYNPDDTLLAVHPGSRDDEAKLHRRFAHQRVAGREWYSLSVDIKHHIDAMLTAHGAPDPGLRCGPKPVEVKRPKHFRDGPGARDWSGGRSA